MSLANCEALPLETIEEMRRSFRDDRESSGVESLVAEIGCHCSYPTSAFPPRRPLVGYDPWHPEGQPKWEFSPNTILNGRFTAPLFRRSRAVAVSRHESVFGTRAQVWQDFHLKYLAAINERLVAQVRPKYIVKMEEHLYIHEIPAEPRKLAGRLMFPWRCIRPGQGGESGAAVLEAPTEIELAAQDVERVPFLEVRDRVGGELITVLELLSPSNKRTGADRDQYLAKRGKLLNSGTHLVELDLLRGGRPLPALHRPDCLYSIMVSRAEDRPARASGRSD